MTTKEPAAIPILREQEDWIARDKRQAAFSPQGAADSDGGVA